MAKITEVTHSEIPGGTRETRHYDNGTSADFSFNKSEGLVDVTHHDHKGNSTSYNPGHAVLGGDPCKTGTKK